MTAPSDDTTAGDVVALARRVGVTLTDTDLRIALELDHGGRRQLREAADLPIDVEPSVSFSPPRVDDPRR